MHIVKPIILINTKAAYYDARYIKISTYLRVGYPIGLPPILKYSGFCKIENIDKIPVLDFTIKSASNL